MLSAFENALVVRLDALEGRLYPTWSLTTTTAKPWTLVRHVEVMADLNTAEKMLWKWMRRDLGLPVEYLGFVEFTTGESARDGLRRPHKHHLVKGLGRPSDGRLVALESQVSEKWKLYTRGAWRVECRPLRTPMGAVAYLALHHNKLEQNPPEGWKGKRFSPSRGYFERPIAELRAEARALMADERVEAALIDAFNVPDVIDEGTLDDLILENIE
ncbi:MAG TPA: hypothetical protein VIL98_10555 [Gaiellaceae bacterium]